MAGVSSAGLIIIGQPAAIVGHTWCTIKFSGWLNALIANTGPIGNFLVNAILLDEALFRFIGISVPWDFSSFCKNT